MTYVLVSAFLFFFLIERHPISHAIDGTNNWWQSPSIQNGREYHWVTITLDLRQVGGAGPGPLEGLRSRLVSASFLNTFVRISLFLPGMK